MSSKINIRSCFNVIFLIFHFNYKIKHILTIYYILSMSFRLQRDLLFSTYHVDLYAIINMMYECQETQRKTKVLNPVLSLAGKRGLNRLNFVPALLAV